MKPLTNAEKSAIAAELGHSQLAVRETRKGRFKPSCVCGWTQVASETPVAAAQAARHHLEVVVRQHVASGVSLPGSARARA